MHHLVSSSSFPLKWRFCFLLKHPGVLALSQHKCKCGGAEQASLLRGQGEAETAARLCASSSGHGDGSLLREQDGISNAAWCQEHSQSREGVCSLVWCHQSLSMWPVWGPLVQRKQRETGAGARRCSGPSTWGRLSERKLG